MSFPEFNTTPMEMEAVANIFDRDGDGYIDYHEFVSALRPNRDVSYSYGPSFLCVHLFLNATFVAF